MKVLQRNRNKILRSNPPSFAVLQELLYPIESEMTLLQNKIVADLRQLRSGQSWKEKYDKWCAGYIARTIAIKQKAQMIDTLIHPEIQQECSTKLDKPDAAHAYYQQLFRSDPVNDQAVTSLTNCITPDQFLLPAHQQDSLSSFITHEVKWLPSRLTIIPVDPLVLALMI